MKSIIYLLLTAQLGFAATARLEVSTNGVIYLKSLSGSGSLGQSGSESSAAVQFTFTYTGTQSNLTDWANIYTNSHTLTASNTLALETWLDISGPTNWLSQHWDAHFRNGASNFSTMLSSNASGLWMGARWVTNTGMAVLQIKGGLTNEDARVSVKANEVAWNTNGVGTVAAAAMSPTNIAGFTDTVYSWYRAADYTTNGGVATLPNLASAQTNAAALNLTNLTEANFPTKNASDLNSLATISFNGDFLQSFAYTNTQPHDVVFVAYLENISLAGEDCLFSGVTSSARNYFRFDPVVGNNVLALQYAGAYNTLDNIPTNRLTKKWMVWRANFNGGSSAIYTNGVTLISGNAGTDNAYGFVIGTGHNGTQPSNMKVAEIATYSAVLSAGGYSNLHYYLTNKYNIAP